MIFFLAFNWCPGLFMTESETVFFFFFYVSLIVYLLSCCVQIKLVISIQFLLMSLMYILNSLSSMYCIYINLKFCSSFRATFSCRKTRILWRHEL